MSFSAHRKAVHDDSLLLPLRASHARSCALHVANKLGVRRGTVLDEVKTRTGIDLGCPAAIGDLLKAFAVLEDLRQGTTGLGGSVPEPAAG